MPCPSCPEQVGLFYEIGGKWGRRFIYIFCVLFIFDSAFAVNELIKSCVLQPSFIILHNNSKTCNPFLMLDVFFISGGKRKQFEHLRPQKLVNT